MIGGLSGLEPFCDGHFLILPNHVIPQILILTIYDWARMSWLERLTPVIAGVPLAAVTFQGKVVVVRYQNTALSRGHDPIA